MRKERRTKNRVPTLNDIEMYCSSVEETLSSIHERCIPKETKKIKKRRATDFEEALEEEHMQLVK